MNPYKEKAYLEIIHNITCPSCTKDLQFSVEKQKIHCENCAYEELINHAKDLVIEQPLNMAESPANDFVPELLGKLVYDCMNCSSQFMVEEDIEDPSCGFCGSPHAALIPYEHELVRPVGIIPFYVASEQAIDIFSKWIQEGWFRPSKLSLKAQIQNLHSIYVPYWTYDAETENRWEGEAGHYYYTMEPVMVNGKIRMKQVQRTRWSHHSGRLNHFFNDVLVLASNGVTQDQAKGILPYHLEEVVNFDPRLIKGSEVELYQTQVLEGYDVAKKVMDYKIRHICSGQLGGDVQQNLKVDSQIYKQTFKHLLLPMWICSYVYNDHTYHFLINGQTGKVSGKKPISYLKIAGLVLAIVLLILLIVFVSQYG